MKRAIWKWIFLGAAVSLLLVYFVELASNGIGRMNGSQQIESAYEFDQYKLNNENYESNLQTQQQGNILLGNETSLQSEITELEQQILALKKKALEKEKIELEQLLLNDDVAQSNVNRLADSTSGALQTLSSSGMQFVAELFHKVIN